MGADPPVIVFDGVCNLCNGAVQFIIRHDRRARFRFAPLQSHYVKTLGADIRLPDTDSIILIDAAGIWQKSNAILRIARQLSGAWPVFGLAIIIPRFVRDAAYDVIARNRYRLFGKQDQCMIPTPQLQDLFYK